MCVSMQHAFSDSLTICICQVKDKVVRTREYINRIRQRASMDAGSDSASATPSWMKKNVEYVDIDYMDYNDYNDYSCHSCEQPTKMEIKYVDIDYNDYIGSSCRDCRGCDGGEGGQTGGTKIYDDDYNEDLGSFSDDADVEDVEDNYRAQSRNKRQKVTRVRVTPSNKWNSGEERVLLAYKDKLVETTNGLTQYLFDAAGNYNPSQELVEKQNRCAYVSTPSVDPPSSPVAPSGLPQRPGLIANQTLHSVSSCRDGVEVPSQFVSLHDSLNRSYGEDNLGGTHKAVFVLADGNCFFSAMCHQLKFYRKTLQTTSVVKTPAMINMLNSTDHNLLRRLVYEELINNSSRYMQRFLDSVEGQIYLDQAGGEGETVFDRNVVAYMRRVDETKRPFQSSTVFEAWAVANLLNIDIKIDVHVVSGDDMNTRTSKFLQSEKIVEPSIVYAAATPLCTRIAHCQDHFWSVIHKSDCAETAAAATEQHVAYRDAKCGSVVGSMIGSAGYKGAIYGGDDRKKRKYTENNGEREGGQMNVAPATIEDCSSDSSSGGLDDTAPEERVNYVDIDGTWEIKARPDLASYLRDGIMPSSPHLRNVKWFFSVRLVMLLVGTSKFKPTVGTLFRGVCHSWYPQFGYECAEAER